MSSSGSNSHSQKSDPEEESIDKLSSDSLKKKPIDPAETIDPQMADEDHPSILNSDSNRDHDPEVHEYPILLEVPLRVPNSIPLVTVPEETSDKFIELYKPADVELAKIHGKARKVARIFNVKLSESVERCKCCNLPVGAERFPLCSNIDSLGELGSSFPLYFVVFKNVVISLLLIFFIACVACIVSNSMAGRQKEWTTDESYNVLTPASFGNIWLNTTERLNKGFEADPLDLPIWQPILHIIACMVLVIAYPLTIKNLREKAIELDLNSTTPSDFTLMVHGLPKSYTKEELQKHIEDNFIEEKISIVNIVCTYDLHEFNNINIELKN